MSVPLWVKETIDRFLPGPDYSRLRVGLTYKHIDGRTVKITKGRYWGEHGISNFWCWQEVLPDGILSDTEEHGYGYKIQVD